MQVLPSLLLVLLSTVNEPPSLPPTSAHPQTFQSVHSEFPDLPVARQSATTDLDVAAVATVPRTQGVGVVLRDGAVRSLSLGVLLQPQAGILREPSGTPSRAYRVSPSLRRMRLVLSGVVHPKVNFMLYIDSLNLGFGGNWSARLFAQDAWVEFNLSEALQLDVGVLALPFLHTGVSGVMALLGIDKPSTTGASLPSYVGTDRLVYDGALTERDLGVMARGIVASGYLNYRVAVTQGIPKGIPGVPVNPRALPRVTGRLTLNLFDQITGATAKGFLAPGLMLSEVDGQLLSPKKVVAVSVNGAYQQDAVLAARLSSYAAAGTDVYLDLPLGNGQQSLNGQVDYAWYRLGPGAGQARHTLFAELGYRFGRLQPLVAWEYVNVVGNNLGDSTYVRGGLNWYLSGHQANLKVDAGAQRTQAVAGLVPAYQFKARVAAQLLF
jgi:hypothetical protein